MSNAVLEIDWGGFTPTSGQSFTIATFGSRIGEFDSITIPPVAGLNFTINYSSTDVVISTNASNVQMLGGLAIGHTSPEATLDISGGIKALNRNASGELYQCNVDNEGTFGLDILDGKLKVCTINASVYEWRAISFE